MHQTQNDKHPLGLPYHSKQGTCEECAWSQYKGPGPKVLRCTAAQGKRIQSDWIGCINWEAELECLRCAACCGPAYDVVEISTRDPVRKSRPEWVVTIENRHQMKRRSDNHCQALLSDNKCQIYEDRPRCCRDFERGGDNCLFARRRLGFTRPWRPL